MGCARGQERFHQLEAQFASARESVEAKLELLEGNKVRVMHKQLELFNGAMVAYFSGNKVGGCKVETR